MCIRKCTETLHRYLWNKLDQLLTGSTCTLAWQDGDWAGVVQALPPDALNIHRFLKREKELNLCFSSSVCPFPREDVVCTSHCKDRALS